MLCMVRSYLPGRLCLSVHFLNRHKDLALLPQPMMRQKPTLSYTKHERLPSAVSNLTSRPRLVSGHFCAIRTTRYVQMDRARLLVHGYAHLHTCSAFHVSQPIFFSP